MATGLTKQQVAKLNAQLDKWQEDLVNLTKRNKLLYFKHAKTSSLEILEPSLSQVAAGLGRPGWSFFLPSVIEDEDEEELGRRRRANELLTSKRSANDVLASLRSLERVSNQTMLDTGLWVLYVGFGMLKWVDPSDQKEWESPLLLQPVALSRPGLPTDFILRATEDDPVINPALSIKLANDFDITLPSIDDIDGPPAAVLDAIRKAVSRKKSWKVEERVVLTTFTFNKEAMYRDLLMNRDAITSSHFVQLAAIGAAAGAERFSFSPSMDEDLDEIAPPEELVNIRDADSTQRKCILAARDGKSFVMDGPPGTGKSQTITNIIAELLYAGKSVLFVSEKAAALDVVSNRLEDAGLSEFVLELHSHKATRKEVAAELGRALEVSPRARSSFSETDRATLARLRQELSDYAVAVNVVRRPLGKSLHQVVGRIVQLQGLPQAPVASAIDGSLAPEELSMILELAERLGRAWRPVLEGDRFLWRSLRDTSYTAARQQEVQRLLDDCSSATGRLLPQLAELDALTGMTWSSSLEGARRGQKLLAAVESHSRRATLPLQWLTTDNLGGMVDRLAQRRPQVEALKDRHSSAQRLAGHRWREVPAGRTAGVNAALSQLAAGRRRLPIDESTTAETLSDVLQRWSDVESRADLMARDAGVVARAFGMSIGALTLRRCDQLAELSSLIGSATPPESRWLSPFVKASLVEAEAVLKELVGDYRQRRQGLSSIFTDGVLDLDLVALRARLGTNTGLRKLGGTYRADKKLLAGCVVGGKVTPAVIEKLDDAIAWRELRTRLQSAESIHSPLLGRYYQGPIETDLDRLERALQVARRAVDLCDGSVPPGLSSQLAVDAQPSPEAVDAGVRLKAAADRWRAEIQPQLASLGGEGTDIVVDEFAKWIREMRPAVTHLHDATVTINQAIERRLSVTQIVNLLAQSDAIREAEAVLASTALEDELEFGPSWRGLATNFDDLTREVSWAQAVIAAAGGPLDDHAAEALVALEPMALVVAEHVSSVDKAWSAIADLFSQPWRKQLVADFGVSFESGRELLHEMRESVADIEEWSRFAQSRQGLVDAGLADVVAFLENATVDASQVAEIVERSVLESWADSIIESDDGLDTLSAVERTNLVESFRQLDRSLVANSAAAVISACTARRPASTLGMAGVIRREAQKKTRHKPIRTLLGETMEVSLALKPCFMMSPLAVSQYIPADAVFDVVIFDEASQVRPSDAVNCIYRGRQLIVAGDPKQLPPTNFFEQMADGGSDGFDDEAPEDFESVLDIFLGSGLPPLSLQWHYRSQHESLITYSNYRFYEGKLHTVPGAIDHAADVGVELIPADGVYRRGTGRDNPIEAAKVVERVLFHRRNHPALTLGVVAFSSAQEAAIVAELERQRESEPEIAGLLGGGDRLDGFFVKNLENVQGDERDIIIFSIGYGPDEHGKFTEQLGPLIQKGGERRLNVAITRARRRVEVVASVTAGDFPGTSSAPGVRHLQRYLDFAERGVQALSLDVVQGGSDAESVFEEAVLACIAGLGHVAVPQVGVAGYRIDIGIRHPSRPGEFILGVECDGAAYHSSRVARDRDRLRQEILEGLGWRMHRIWGPAWFRDRLGQEEALKSAIADALHGRSPSRRPKLIESPGPKVEIDEVDLDAMPDWAEEYEVSSYRPGSWFDPAEVHAVPTRDFVVAVERIVRDEGPIHEDALRRRLAEAYGVRRIGDRIKTAFDKAIEMSRRGGSIERVEKVFIQCPGTKPSVRTPNEDDEQTKRAVAQVPASERQLAIELLVASSHRVDKDDLRVAFGRLFGWKRVGTDIDAAFERDLAVLVKAKRVLLDGRNTIVAP